MEVYPQKEGKEPMRLVECVPNFSEGRRKDVIEAIVSPFRGRSGCSLLDYRADADHNRLVVSLAGEPEPICDALIEAALAARENIDMNGHTGAHPRIGAVDVIPFTPIRNITMEECVRLARDFGARYHRETDIPVYFYEDAATRPDRRRLEVIRKGQYEVLKMQVVNTERHPDIGEPKLHPTAGATVIGARKFLVAFNINLGTSDVAVANSIAKIIRASGGGFPAVKAMGVDLAERGIVQVSMNIVDYENADLYRILEVVRMEARRYGVEVVDTEIYGMIPADAILRSAAYYLQVKDFDPRQVLEVRLLEGGGAAE